MVHVLQLFTNGGIVNITVREISRNRKRVKEILSATLTLIIFILICMFALLYLGVESFLAESHLKVPIYLLAVSALITVHASARAAVIRAHEDMGRIALTSFIQRGTLLVAVLFAIFFEKGIEGIAFAYLMAAIVNWLLYFLFVTRYYSKVIWLIDFDYWRYLVREALPLGISLVLRKMTLHVDTFLLAFLSTTIAVGLFNSAYRFIQMIEIATLGLCSVLFPVLSRLAKESQYDFQLLFNNSVRIFIALSIPIAVWLIIASKKLVVLVYGEEYREACKILMILAINLVFLMPGSIFFFVLSALGRQRMFLILSTVGLFVNAGLDGLLIPYYDYLGAAAATTFTEFVIFVSGIFLLYKLKLKADYLSFYWRSIFSIVLPSLIMYLCFKNDSYVLWVVATLIYIVLYIIIAIKIELVKKIELQFLINSLSRKNKASECSS